MAQQTINIGASPNDGTGTPLRTAFQYTNSNFSELYTAVGPSGNNIVVPGNATISGALAANADTTLGTASKSTDTNLNFSSDLGTQRIYLERASRSLVFRDVTSALENYRIAGITGVHTWGVGGSTAMTLNSTGLGVGGSVTNKLTVTVTPPTSNSDGLVINGPSSRQIIAGITGATYSYAGVGANQNLIYGGNAQLNILGDNQNVRIGTSAGSYLLLDTSGNLGIGVTPSYKLDVKSATASNQLRIFGSNQNSITFGNAAGGASNGFLMGRSFSSDDANNLFVYDITSSALRFFIGDTGFVGIGTAAPTEAVDVNSGNLKLTNGNLVLGTSGKGIDFSATASGSGTMTSELLSDYEEGTFTPTVTASTGTLTTTTVNEAVYTKIGRLVSVAVDISIVNVGTASGQLFFSLPFNQTVQSNVGALRELGATGQMGQIIYQSGTQVSASLYNNGTLIVNGYRIRGTYTYTV